MRPLEPDYDTVIVPAREDDFLKVFVGERRWYPIRLSAESRERLKFVAAYRVAPISAVTHVADIRGFTPIDRIWWTIELDNIREIKPVPFVTGDSASVQTPRFAAMNKLLASESLSPLLRRR